LALGLMFISFTAFCALILVLLLVEVAPPTANQCALALPALLVSLTVFGAVYVFIPSGAARGKRRPELDAA
jgi:hypothetical protein